MATSTSKAYECSRSNATVTRGPTEWINEFSNPIELEPGDQVRVLGSFINEASTGDSMEITEPNNSFNINFLPYIKGTTYGTSSSKEDLITLGQIATPAYSTDAFGIEPPYSQKYAEHLEGDVVAPEGKSSYVGVASAGYAIGSLNADSSLDDKVGLRFDTVALYNDPDITATLGEKINGDKLGGWDCQNQQATTWGNNLITGNYRDKFNSYKTFAEASVPNDFLISTMCKKIILPVLDKFQTFDYGAYPALKAYNMDGLVRDAPIPSASSNGVLNKAPQVGDYICTIDIGQSNGWYDNAGIPWQERTWNTGYANLKSGPQSVVGKILAVRPIVHRTTDTISTTGKSFIKLDCFEVYVYDCFNGAKVNNMLKWATAQPNDVMQIDQILPTQHKNANPISNLVKAAHGAAEYNLGYSPNPSYNHINGMWNARKSSSTGTYGGVPSVQTYGSKTDYGNADLPVGYNPQNFPMNDPVSSSGEVKYQQGSDLNATELSNWDYGYGKSMGLSYLWSGSYTGSECYLNNNPIAEDGALGTEAWAGGGNLRENTISYIGEVGGDTTWNLQVFNGKYSFQLTSDSGGAQNPVMDNDNTEDFNTTLGALICVKAETMDAILKGHYDGSNDLLATGVTTATTGGGTENTFTINCDDITGLNTNMYINIGNMPGNLSVKKIFSIVGGVAPAGVITLTSVLDATFAASQITLNDPTGYIPRIWAPWTYQYEESDYNERHYKKNSYTTNNTLTNDRALGATILQSADTPADTWIVRQEENRFDIGFAAQPTNWNWRQPYLPNKHSFQTIGNIPNGCTTNTLSGEVGPAPIVAPFNYGTHIDRMPRYFSTVDGRKINGIPTNNGTSGGDQVYWGAPYVWGGYQNTNISVYFQQPETGDVGLSRTNIVQNISATLQSLVAQTYSIIGSTGQDLTGWYVFPDFRNTLWETGVKVTTYTLGLDDNFRLEDSNGAPFTTGFATPMKIMFSQYKNGARPSGGTSAEPWAGDCLTLKEYNMKITVPTGFYTNQHIATEINKVLHQSSADYTKNQGTYNPVTNQYEVPSTVGNQESSSPSENSIINANFIQTYIPDLSYGFMPVTSENATKLNQPSSTTGLSIKTYDTYDANTATWTFYPSWDLDNQTVGVDVKTMTNTPCGTHIKFFSPPYLDKQSHAAGQAVQLHLFKLKGGALNYTDYDATAGVEQWQNKQSRIQFYETLKSVNFTVNDATLGYTSNGKDSTMIWPTRLNRNLLLNGGGSKIFAGANNPTFQYNPDEDRLQFTNLYTPFRPHDSSNPAHDSFDIGDAIPAAIINARKSGAIISSIAGLYITNLNADSITESNYGVDFFNNVKYDTLSDSLTQANGSLFLNQLGFDSLQISKFSNSLNLKSLPFTYIDQVNNSGETLTNRAKIDTAINASNPLVSNCTTIAPVRQFYAEIESDVVSATNPSTRGTNPFYLIGSDFPGSQFFGSTVGQRLPVIGICSRNFSAFNFVFDLGGSSISYTMDRKVSIKSIKTAIYTSKLATPQNLNDNSSVIYLVTKQKYVNQITNQDDTAQIAQILQAQAQQQMVGGFYNPSEASYRTGIPPELTPKQTKAYYESEGSYYSDTETDDPFENEWRDTPN